MTALKTSNWDAITAAAPLNKDAAIARDGHGVTFEVPAKAKTNAFDAPFPTREFKGENYNNLTGQRFQRLVVLGVRAGKLENEHAIWVCRCDCGRYCNFLASTLKKLRAEGAAMCSECDYIEAVKSGQHATKEELEARAAQRAEERERRERLKLLVHPKLQEMKAAFIALGFTANDFRKAILEFARIETEGYKAEQAAKGETP